MSKELDFQFLFGGFRAELVRAIWVLANDTAVFAAHFHIFVDVVPASFHVRSILSFVNCYKSDVVLKVTKMYCGTVFVNIVTFL